MEKNLFVDVEDGEKRILSGVQWFFNENNKICMKFFFILDIYQLEKSEDRENIINYIRYWITSKHRI